ncbi:MAG: hypothetical protein ACHQ49_11930 [Elusimicrobiota bacterium]
MRTVRGFFASFLAAVCAVAPFTAAAQVVAGAGSAALPAVPRIGAVTTAAPSLATTLSAPAIGAQFSAPALAAPAPALAAVPTSAAAAASAPTAPRASSATKAPAAASTQLAAAGDRLSAAAKNGGRGDALAAVFSGASDSSSRERNDAAIDAAPRTDDEIIHRLWGLAKRSKSKRVKVGAMVVDRNGTVVGEGWNRASTKAERRLMRVGIILHGEQGALAQAWRRTKGQLEGARVYAMGISQDAKLYVSKIKPIWACETCARSMERFHVSAMSSSAHGYKEFLWNEVLPMAKENAKGRWWQSAHKEDPNIRWRPIADVLERLGKTAEAPAAITELRTKDFVPTGDYSRPFLKSLSPMKKTGELALSPKQVKELGVALAARARKLPFETYFFGPLRSSRYEKAHAAYLGVFYKAGAPAGYFDYVVHRAKDGALEGEVRDVYFEKGDPRVSGIADVVLDFLSKDLDPLLGVTRETLKADTAGRYVWAMKGFQFDPAYRYYFDVDGKKVSTRQIARANFGRFLKRYGIPIKKLVLRGKPVKSLDALTTPADFAEVVAAGGKTIRLRPLVNHKILGDEADYPVGKAFMMSNYMIDGPPYKPPYVISSGGAAMGKKFAADAMPWWMGAREAGRTKRQLPR